MYETLHIAEIYWQSKNRLRFSHPSVQQCDAVSVLCCLTQNMEAPAAFEMLGTLIQRHKGTSQKNRTVQ